MSPAFGLKSVRSHGSVGPHPSTAPCLSGPVPFLCLGAAPSDDRARERGNSAASLDSPKHLCVAAVNPHQIRPIVLPCWTFRDEARPVPGAAAAPAERHSPAG